MKSSSSEKSDVFANDPEVHHEIFVGTSIGSFKRHVSNTDQTSLLNNVKDLQKGDEIVQLSWANEDQTKILIGQTNGIVKTFDLDTQTFKVLKRVTIEQNKLIGLGISNDTLITGLSSGQLIIGNEKSEEITTGTCLDRIRFNSNDATKVATGGKENPLKLWDLNTKKVTFTAKNIPHDALQLRVPIWVSDIAFLSDFELATASRYDNVCFYDTRVQRRPIVRLESPDSAYSCICTTSNDKVVVTGGGKGIIHAIDLRKTGKVIHKYKGPVGAVTDVKTVDNQPYLFSVSLDRRLRIHNLDTTSLIEETYLKTRLNCLLVKPFKIKTEKENTILNIDSSTKIDKSKRKGTFDEKGDYLYENEDIYDDEPELKIDQSNNKKLKKSKKLKSS